MLSYRFQNKSGMKRILATSATAVALTAFVAGCGSNSSSEPSPGATETATNSPTASPSNTQASGAQCNLASVKAVVPSEYKIVKFQCNTYDGTNWAVVTATPGPEVFFLRDQDNKWNALKASEVCGTASAGLPTQILSYCPS